MPALAYNVHVRHPGDGKAMRISGQLGPSCEPFDRQSVWAATSACVVGRSTGRDQAEEGRVLLPAAFVPRLGNFPLDHRGGGSAIPTGHRSGGRASP